MTAILGSRKHVASERVLVPNHDSFALSDALAQAATDFLDTMNKWRSFSGQIKKTWDNKNLHDCTLSLKRSEKTDKITMSESAKQTRSGHDTLQAAFVKTDAITAFQQLETTILSIPALCHPAWRMHYRSVKTDHHQFFLQDQPLFHYASIAPLAQALTYLAHALHKISTDPDAPLWIVDRTVLPANTAGEALWIYHVLRAMRETEKKRAPVLAKTPTYSIGAYVDIAEALDTCNRYKP